MGMLSASVNKHEVTVSIIANCGLLAQTPMFVCIVSTHQCIISLSILSTFCHVSILLLRILCFLLYFDYICYCVDSLYSILLEIVDYKFSV